MDIKTIIIIIIGIAVLALLAAWFWYMRRQSSNDELFDEMEGTEFEEYCAELLEAKGFENVEMTPASHDYGIDIIADKDGISYAIQCKCYSDPIGIKAIQEAYAGKDYYDSMVAVVMTNDRCGDDQSGIYQISQGICRQTECCFVGRGLCYGSYP